MDDLFHKLETRLKTLLQKYDHLKHVNANLRQHQSVITREKELLIAKNKIAITQIENMVSRLKSIENHHE
jgi:uncharacterized protein (TIGR02449 family)